MRRTAATILALAACTEATSARAEFPKFEIPRLGIFRKKKEDPPPQPAPNDTAATATTPAPVAKAVNPSIVTLKNSRDERARVAAAQALRTADPKQDATVIPTLMTSLQQDPSVSVRTKVAETIGLLKPISVEAGAILEQAVVGDPSEEVRKSAQAALWQYHVNGYRSSAANAAVPQTSEPPLAKPRTIAPNPPQRAELTSRIKPTPAPAAEITRPQPVARPISTGIGRGAIYPQTIEPPLAKPKEEIKPPMPSIQTPTLLTEPPEAKKETSTLGIPAIPVPPPANVFTIPPPESK